MSVLSWDDYVRGAVVDHERFRISRERFGRALARQRELVRELIQSQGMQRVACLGAGFLNDVPVAVLLGTAVEFYLVDWIPEVAVQGFRWSLIEQRSGLYACEACVKGRHAERYCGAFKPPIWIPHEVCSNFSPSTDPPAWCTAFTPGGMAHFGVADVTGGRATYFARRAAGCIARAKTPEQAVRELNRLAGACGRLDEPAGIPERSIDLVSSSMVLSQFNREPFEYTLARLRERFGEDMPHRRSGRLEAALGSLRAALHSTLVEGHALLLSRLLRPRTGRVYVAVEWFRADDDNGPYFVVEETLRAFEILGRHFLFDFDAVSAERSANVSAMSPGRSVIGNHVLRPIEREAAT